MQAQTISLDEFKRVLELIRKQTKDRERDFDTSEEAVETEYQILLNEARAP